MQENSTKLSNLHKNNFKHVEIYVSACLKTPQMWKKKRYNGILI